MRLALAALGPLVLAGPAAALSPPGYAFAQLGQPFAPRFLKRYL